MGDNSIRKKCFCPSSYTEKRANIFAKIFINFQDLFMHAKSFTKMLFGYWFSRRRHDQRWSRIFIYVCEHESSHFQGFPDYVQICTNMYIAHWFITHPSYTAIQCFLPDDIKLPKPEFYMKIRLKHELLMAGSRL